MHSKYENGMAKRVDPDQTAPLAVWAVSALSTYIPNKRFFLIFTFDHFFWNTVEPLGTF